MEYLKERVAYLRGLADGLSIEQSSKEGKILLHIIKTLEDFAEAIDSIDTEHAELVEYVDTLNDDLADVEDEIYGWDDEDIDFIKIICPNCGEDIYVEEDIYIDVDAEVTCPRCSEIIKLENYEECSCQ